jgi:hypothetical protein
MNYRVPRNILNLYPLHANNVLIVATTKTSAAISKIFKEGTEGGRAKSPLVENQGK